MPSAAKASDTSGTPRHYTEYVVLYVPPEGSFKDAVKYQLGLDRLALVGTDTIKYNDMLGKTYEVPIISRRTIAAKSPQD